MHRNRLKKKKKCNALPVELEQALLLEDLCCRSKESAVAFLFLRKPNLAPKLSLLLQWAFFSWVHWPMEEPNPCIFNPAILDSLTDDAVQEILDGYNGFCNATQSLLVGNGDLSVAPDFVSLVHVLCKHRLRSLVQDHFFRLLEVPHNLFP